MVFTYKYKTSTIIHYKKVVQIQTKAMIHYKTERVFTINWTHIS